MKKKNLYIVHCIDTEGPLDEDLYATFERLEHIFHLKFKPSFETLKKLQNAEINLLGKEEAVKQVLDPHLLNYNNSWEKIKNMMLECLSSNFRKKYSDDFKNGWVYNWHFVDHVDYDFNPRKRHIGYHAIYDEYKKIFNEFKECKKDGFHFHYHPHPLIKHAHLCATRWLGPTDKLFQILSRRIIDRHWFPSVNRPGFQVNRPDSHWFLEQFIPFDYATLAMEQNQNDMKQFDFSDGRSGDWRRAPITWEPYHPSHDDYQEIGNCRRWITRCLNIGTRAYLLGEKEIDLAFREAKVGKPAILAFANHDFRDIRDDIEKVYNQIRAISKKYPEVNIINSEAVFAMRNSLNIKKENPCDLEIDIEELYEGTHKMSVKTKTKTFGPQPYLAFKSSNGDYYHDNFDFQKPFHEWSYVFDEETIKLSALDKIGVASNNSYGTTTVSIYDVKKKKKEKYFHNL